MELAAANLHEWSDRERVDAEAVGDQCVVGTQAAQRESEPVGPRQSCQSCFRVHRMTLIQMLRLDISGHY